MNESDIQTAKKISLETGFVRAVVLQRRMKIGYPKAAAIERELVSTGFCARENPGEYYKVAAQPTLAPDFAEVCEYCDKPKNSPNYAYHVCVGRKAGKA